MHATSKHGVADADWHDGLVTAILQAGSSSEEWQAAKSAATTILDEGAELVAELERQPCFLLMEFVPGKPLSSCKEDAQVCRLEPQ